MVCIENLTCGFLNALEVDIPKSLLNVSRGMMINDEIVWNNFVNKKCYENFPLASIFDPLIFLFPLNLNYSLPKIWGDSKIEGIEASIQTFLEKNLRNKVLND